MKNRNDELLSYFKDDVFRSVFDSSSIGMVLIAPDGKWLAVNEALCRLSGASRDELLEHSLQTITYPEDIEPDVAQMRRLISGEIDYYQIKKRFIHRTGRIFWALKSASAVRDETARLRLVVAQIQDVSETMRLDEELKKSQKELENVLENTYCAFAQYDREARFIYGNSRLAQILGVPLSEIVGKTIRDLSPIIYQPERLEQVILKIFATKQSGFFESERKIDGRPGFLLTHLTPQLDENGEVETVIALAFNTTKLKRAEIRLSKALVELGQLRKILPICSNCKNIRSDQDYWQTVESYISSKTDTKFSHSICPNCYETIVKPELDKYLKRKRR